MSNELKKDIAQARAEIDVAIGHMKAGIRLCEATYDRLGKMTSQRAIDDLMQSAFKECPIGYTMLMISLIADDYEREGGWTAGHISALLFAAERLDNLAETLAAAGMVSDAVMRESEKITKELLAEIFQPKRKKGRLN